MAKRPEKRKPARCVAYRNETGERCPNRTSHRLFLCRKHRPIPLANAMMMATGKELERIARASWDTVAQLERKRANW
jgi:hypothetical protein